MAGRKSKITDGDKARVCARWLNGEGITQLAKEHNVHYDTIRNIIRNAGLSKTDRANLKGVTNEQRTISLAAYEAIPDPDPDDPLDQARWLFQISVANVGVIAKDRNYSGTEVERRKELSLHSTTAHKLFPLATLHKARRQLGQEVIEIEYEESGIEEIAED